MAEITCQVYESKLSVVGTKLSICAEEEKLIEKKMEFRREKIAEEASREVFFDAQEDMDTDEVPHGQVTKESGIESDPVLERLKEDLNSVHRKRATLRNRKNVVRDEYNKVKLEKDEIIRKLPKPEEIKVSKVPKHVVPKRPIPRSRHSSGQSSTSGQGDNSLEEARSKALKRIKSYRQKQSVRSAILETDPVEENSDLSFPPPPTEDMIGSSKVSTSEVPNSSFPTSVPPPPPPMPSIPPPPPPPPPLSFSRPPPPPPPPPGLFSPPPGILTLREPLRKVAKEVNPSGGGSSMVDLNELLKIRRKLKKPDPKVNEPKSENPLHAVLKTINRVTADSDDEDRKSDDDRNEWKDE